MSKQLCSLWVNQDGGLKNRLCSGTFMTMWKRWYEKLSIKQGEKNVNTTTNQKFVRTLCIKCLAIKRWTNKLKVAKTKPKWNSIDCIMVNQVMEWFTMVVDKSSHKCMWVCVTGGVIFSTDRRKRTTLQKVQGITNCQGILRKHRDKYLETVTDKVFYSCSINPLLHLLYTCPYIL